MDTKQPSNKTELNDRTLWFDGDSTFPAKNVVSKTMISSVKFVDEITPEIKKFNKLVPPEQRMVIKKDVRPFNFEWVIPQQYKDLNIRRHIIERLQEEIAVNKWDDDGEITERAVRVHKELKLYENHGLNDVLRVLIFVINTLNNEGVVWGVGRGSSVSSYVLYLIGVHDVDSVEYDLDIADFLH